MGVEFIDEDVYDGRAGRFIFWSLSHGYLLLAKST
jgi:hypothetical protein